MTAIAHVSVINHYHINELHLFWDTVYNDSFLLISMNILYLLQITLVFISAITKNSVYER